MSKHTTLHLMDDYFPPEPEPETDYPEPWELWLNNAEPMTVEVLDYTGYGPDAEERPVDVEVTAGYPPASEVFGR